MYPTTRKSFGALSFLGRLSLRSRRDGTCFPCGMFLHCASNADYLYVNAKESLAENAASPLVVGKSPVVRGNPGDRLAQGNGRGSHTVTQVWFGIAVAAALTESPFWYSARLHSPDSRFTRESPRFSKIAHVDRHLAAEQRRARMTLELLNCRQPGACLPVRQMQIPRCGRGCARRLRW
jgi:hypothetical protein